MFECTEFYELWRMFVDIINITPPTEVGYSLDGFSAYALTLEELPLPHSLFWEVMIKFLTSFNENFQNKLSNMRKKN